MKLPSGGTLKIVSILISCVLLFILLEVNTIPMPVFIAGSLLVGGLWLYITIKEMRRQGKHWYKQPELFLTITLFLSFPTKYKFSTFQPLPTIFLIALLALLAIVFQKRHEMLYGPNDVDSDEE